MGVNYNTLPTNRGLLFSCDFSNPKNYNISTENMFVYSEQFDAGSWSKPGTNPTPVNDLNPLGQSGGVYLVSNTIGQLSSVGQSVTMSNSSSYTISIYAKSLSGTGVIAFEVSTGAGYTVPIFNLSNLTTSGGGTNLTITNIGSGWYRLSATVTTGSTGDCQFNTFYFGNYGGSSIQSSFLIFGAQIQRSSSLGSYVKSTASPILSSTITDQISGLTGLLNNNGYCYFDTSTRSMQFDRSSTVVTGGFAQFTGTGNLTATNFLYNDHTMEIFAKINTYSASGINVNEGSNALFVYQGYHSGFLYDAATGIYYGLWRLNPSIAAPVWQIPIANCPPAGTWFHLVATRSGSTTSVYLNGQLFTSSSFDISGNPGVSDFIKIGAGNPLTGPYAAYT